MIPPIETNEGASGRKIATLTAKANLLMALLSHADESLAKQKKEVKCREEKLAKLRCEIERRDLDLAQRDAELVRRDGELGQLRREIERRDLDLDRLAGEIAGRDEQLGLLQGKANRHDAEFERTVQQLAAVEHSLEQACKRNNQFLNSRTWRVTAPLRALRRWATRVLLGPRRST